MTPGSIRLMNDSYLRTGKRLSEDQHVQSHLTFSKPQDNIR